MEKRLENVIDLRGATVVAAVLSLLLAALLYTGANLDVFFSINRFPWPVAARLWSSVTIFGDTLPLLCLLLPFFSRRPDFIWTIMVSVIVVAFGVDWAKEYFHTPRPPAVLLANQFHLIGFRAVTGSFPSGHSAAAFTFAGAICMMRFPWPAKVAALSGAALVAMSRVAVGIHWPLDVLGGALFGWFGVMASIWLASRWRWGLKLGAQRGFAVLLVAAALFMAWDYDAGYPLARPLLVTISVVTLVWAWPGLRRLFGKNAL